MKQDSFQNFGHMVDDYIVSIFTSEMLAYFSINEKQTYAYHYTNAEALMSILKSKTIRATNIRFMNDTSELNYAINLFSEFVNSFQHHKDETVNKRILSFYNEHLIKLIESKIERTFVTSFSLNSDSLHLWNSYGKNDGYAIGFRIRTLLENFYKKKVNLVLPNEKYTGNFSFYFGKVLYEKRKQLHFLEGLVKILDSFLIRIETEKDIEEKKNLENRRVQISQYIMSVIYEMKYLPHSIEDEYRFIIIPDQDYAGIEYINKNGLITPYITLSGDLAIENIVIGPKISDKLSSFGLNMYLTSLKISNISIKKSEIEIR